LALGIVNLESTFPEGKLIQETLVGARPRWNGTRLSHWEKEHMPDLERKATVSLRRLLPRLRARFAAEAETATWQEFITRVEREFAGLFFPLIQLYGHQYDFFYHLEETLAAAARAWLDRPPDLQALDATRERTPHR
jgi:hypothetical protein